MNIFKYVVVLGLIGGAASGLHAADKNKRFESEGEVISVISIQSVQDASRLQSLVLRGPTPVSKIVALFKQKENIPDTERIVLKSPNGNLLKPDDMIGVEWKQQPQPPLQSAKSEISTDTLKSFDSGPGIIKIYQTVSIDSLEKCIASHKNEITDLQNELADVPARFAAGLNPYCMSDSSTIVASIITPNGEIKCQRPYTRTEITQMLQNSIEFKKTELDFLEKKCVAALACFDKKE